MLLRDHAQLVAEGVVSDLLHVVPIGDNAVFNGVLLAHVHRNALMSGLPDDGWEHNWRRGKGRVLSSAKSALHLPEPLSMTSTGISFSTGISEGGGRTWSAGWLQRVS